MSNNQDNNESSINSFEHEKWEAEKAFREREISIKEQEQANKEAELGLKKEEHSASRWQNPLIIAIIAAALAAVGNIILTSINGVLQRQLEAQKSEQTRILEMIKTGDPDKAAENLEFLRDAGLISDPDIYKKLGEYLDNRQPGKGTTLPLSSQVENLSNRQTRALTLLLKGQKPEAQDLSEQNLQALDTLLEEYPDSVELHVLKGYTLKDIYQTSKNSLSQKERSASLDLARASFERALQLNPQNAMAHNGMGNVLFFEGKYDEAIKKYDRALELININGKYSAGERNAVEHDKRLAEAAKNRRNP